MSSPVATVEHDVTLQEAAEAMAADDIGALLVVSRGRPVGILSERDVIAHVATGSDLSHVTAGDAMSLDVLDVELSTPVAEAAALMVTAEVRHLPVRGPDGVVGMLSVRDVLLALTPG